MTKNLFFRWFDRVEILFPPTTLPLGWFSLLSAMSASHLSVPSYKTNFPVDRRHLVKERIAYIGLPSHSFWFFIMMSICIGKWLMNQPTVHNRGVFRGRVFGSAPTPRRFFNIFTVVHFSPHNFSRLSPFSKWHRFSLFSATVFTAFAVFNI